jgi:hypothetical protein
MRSVSLRGDTVLSGFPHRRRASTAAILLCAKCSEAADGWKCTICGSVPREDDPGTRRNDPTAHSPTVSAADIPTSPGCAPGSEPTHRRSELRSRRTCWPQYRSNALGEQRVEPAGDPAGVC